MWLLIVIIIVLVTVIGIVLSISNNNESIQENNDSSQSQIQEEKNNEIVDNVVNNEEVKKLTQEKVLELAKRVLENGRGSSDEVVKVLYGQYIATTSEEFTQNSASYKITNVNYSDFKSEVLKYFSEDYFNSINKFKNMTIAIEKNEKVVILQGSWSGASHEVTKASLNKKENGIYYYKIQTVDNRSNTFITYDMTIKLVNDNFVIDSLDMALN